MQRAVNVARSIHDVSAHATTYVPLAIPSLGLSPSIHFNRSSWWHTSALLSVAVESMTLPSRLRHLSHTRGNLDTMSATLNTNGNQRIAHLSCRFHDGGTTSIMTRTGPQANDDRVSGSTTARGNGGDDDVGRASDDIDMNLSCGEVQGTNGLGGRRRKEDHVFGRIGHFRGFTEQHGTDHEEEDELWRNQKRLGLPVVEQSVLYSTSDDVYFFLHFFSGARLFPSGTRPRMRVNRLRSSCIRILHAYVRDY